MTTRVLFSRLLRRRNGPSATSGGTDTRIALSRSAVTFLVSGNTITASPVPVPLPIATRLFGRGVKPVGFVRR